MAPRRRPSSSATWLRWGLGLVGGGGAIVALGAVVVLVGTPEPGTEAAPGLGVGPAPLDAAAPVASVGTVDLDRAPPPVTGTLAPDARCAGCDILLVTVCSLRKDHVGAYGVLPDLTPSADRFAADGFRFEHAYSASNFTLASLSAVLTGRFGSSSGVTGWHKGLPDDIPVLPEILGRHGYRTGAFTVDAPSGFRPDYGLDRGFQRMHVIPSPRDTPDGRTRGGSVGPGGASAASVEAWFGSEPDDPRPRLTMFHTRSAHFPFVIEAPEAGADPTGISDGLWNAGRATPVKAGQAMPGMAGGTAQEGVVDLGGTDPLEVLLREGGEAAEAAWAARYAEAVGRMDLDLARALAALEASGRADRTILVLVGDHGESLNDHGEMLHGDAYFNSVVNVPLLIHVPGLSGGGRSVPALVSQVDLLPTLLELVGAAAPIGIDGMSLVPVLTGEKAEIRAATLVEGGVARQRSGAGATGAVITRDWALVRQWRGCGPGWRPDPRTQPPGPPTCLYDLRADFAQDRDVAAVTPDVVAELQQMWDGYRAARGGAGADVELSPALADELKRTGYDLQPRSP